MPRWLGSHPNVRLDFHPLRNLKLPFTRLRLTDQIYVESASACHLVTSGTTAYVAVRPEESEPPC